MNFEYFAHAAAYIYYLSRSFLNKYADWIVRILEGIAIGMYANLIGDFIKGGFTPSLIYLSFIAIILTIRSGFKTTNHS